ncbi:cardiolipin synthase [Paenibacillus sp. CMAA1364]
MIWLVVALSIFIVQIAVILLLEFRNTTKALSWIFIMFCCPIVGFVIYYFVGRDYIRLTHEHTTEFKIKQEEPLQSKKEDHANHDVEVLKNNQFRHQKRLFQLLTHLPGGSITSCNDSRVLTDGKAAYQAMLAAMEVAKDHIHVEFYIFRADMIGTEFQEVMVRKAREGVKVRVMCDGIGSYHLKSSFIRKFKNTGIEFHFFLPFGISMLRRRINYRNHRKIVIVDGLKGFSGGLNVGDDYLGLYPEIGHWRDTHLELEGDVVYDLQTIFLHDWMLASGERVKDASMFPVHECCGTQQIQLLSSGPDQVRDALQELCFGAITVASERIWITSPYFVPDRGISQGLKTAALSGVDVRIIIPYIPDSKWVHMASLSHVGDLLDAGVRVYQYHKGFMHAKTMIIDHLITTIGTANMDMRSFFCNFELAAVLFDQESIDRVEKDFLNDLEVCSEIIPHEFSLRSRWQKGLEILCRLLSPLL